MLGSPGLAINSYPISSYLVATLYFKGLCVGPWGDKWVIHQSRRVMGQKESDGPNKLKFKVTFLFSNKTAGRLKSGYFGGISICFRDLRGSLGEIDRGFTILGQWGGRENSKDSKKQYVSRLLPCLPLKKLVWQNLLISVIYFIGMGP